MSTILMKKGKEMTCRNPQCCYKWVYKGELRTSTCPSCRTLNKVER